MVLYSCPNDVYCHQNAYCLKEEYASQPSTCSLISPADQLICLLHYRTQAEGAASIWSMPFTCQREKEKENRKDKGMR